MTKVSFEITSIVMQADRPFFGICLGLQLLFEGSEENGGVEGLGLIPGRVTQFKPELGLPVPHIGWNDLDQRCGLSLLPALHCTASKVEAALACK